MLVVVCLAVAPPAEAFPQSPRATVSELRGLGTFDQLLLDARKAKRPSQPLSQRLFSRGEGTCGELFDYLSAGSLQLRVGDRGRASEPLTDAERHAMTDALDRFPLKSIRKLLAERLEADPSQSARLTAIGLVAEIGEPSDVNLLMDWAQLEGAQVRIPRAVRSALGEGLGTLLMREPTIVHQLPKLYGGANPSLLPAFMAALGSEASPARIDTLGSLLGLEPRFDAHVLAEISNMARRARFVTSEMTLARVRRYLPSDQVALSGMAMSIAQTVGDSKAIPGLLKHLGGRDVEQRRQAAVALAKISGEQLEPTLEAWGPWHTRTAAWWKGERKRFIDLARNGKPGAASRAIQELSMLRTYRHDLVPGLSAVLAREEVELVVLATASLGHLGSMDAIPHLVAQLEKENVDVRRAAYHALRRMTGENYSDDPQAWRAAGWGVAAP